jgi:alcohol dehydrogenase
MAHTVRMTKPAAASPGLSAVAATPVLFPAFDYQPLGRVVYGAGELARLGELVKEYGGTRVLLVTDPGIEAAGHPQKALRIMRAAGLDVFVFDEVEENPETGHIVQGVEVAKQHGIDFLVAVGGGSSMDVAKGINFLLTNGGKMTDYRGYGKATKPMLPSIGVPTTSGTGSEAQSFALIADTSSHMKMACGDRKAAFRVALLDPELTISQPHSVTAITGLDALAHAVESFVCTKRSPLSQIWSLAAWRHLEPNYERVLEAPFDLPARSAMQIGSHLAGLAIEASMLGAAHACANPLSAHYGLTHGIAVGVLLPHVVRYNAVSVGHLYGELVECAGRSNGEPAAEVLAARITELMQRAGLPTTLSSCGVSRSILPLLAEEANQQWTARFNPRPLTDTDLQRLYEAAW